MEKMNYEAPAVLENVVLETEGGILGASVVTDDTYVETTGQEINEIDMTGSSYNHSWE